MTGNRRGGALLVLALALGTTGCASALSGHGTSSVVPVSTSGPTSFPSTPATSSTSTAGPTSSTPTAPPATPASSAAVAPAISAAQVEARIERPPAGATAWSSAWARTRHPSASSFVAHVYDKQFLTSELARLHAEGLQDITHQTWYATNAHQADMVLLRFAGNAGAIDRFAGVTGAKSRASGVRNFPVSANPYAVGYYTTKPDSLGNVVAIVYGRVANVAVEEFYFSPHKLSAGDAVAWMRLQLRRLAA